MPYEYECFLKLVKTSEMVSIELGKQLYQKYKHEQNQIRQTYLQKIYNEANLEDIIVDLEENGKNDE